MSFSETIFLFFLALIIFGPKKLPEIARQAGKLLAELRRASNEFKSQIETEIAHLEVEKRESQKNDQTALPPGAVPPGTVASLSLNPASARSSPHNPMAAATLAEPTETPSPAIGSEPTSRNETASAFPTDNSSTSNSVSPSEEVTATSDPASQASHV